MTKKKDHLSNWDKWRYKHLHGLKWHKQKGPELKFQNGKWVRSGKWVTYTENFMNGNGVKAVAYTKAEWERGLGGKGFAEELQDAN